MIKPRLRLLYILPAFLIIVTSLIILTLPHSQPLTISQNDLASPSLAATWTSPSPTQNWLAYSSSNLRMTFSYPPFLSATESPNQISLSHSLPASHPDPCNFAAQSQLTVPDITDFHLTFEISPHDLISTFRQQNGPYITQNYISNNQIKLEPGFIDKKQLGPLEAYQMTSGVEGCGNYTYYAPLDSSHTLVITRDIIPEFSGAVTDPERFLSLPGIITPNQEEIIFFRILSTFKFIEK